MDTINPLKNIYIYINFNNLRWIKKKKKYEVVMNIYFHILMMTLKNINNINRLKKIFL